MNQHRSTRQNKTHSKYIKSKTPSLPNSASEKSAVQSIILNVDRISPIQVSCDQISCSWVRRFPLNEGIEEGHRPPKNRCFTATNSSSVKTVADRHRLIAYHNKHCWRPFRVYQPWNPKNGFSIFFQFQPATYIWRMNFRRNYWT